MASLGFMEILQQLLGTLPIVIAMFVGLVLAVTRRDRHPRASLYTTIGVAAGLLNVVLGFVVQAWLHQRSADGLGYSDMGMVFAASTAVRGLLSAAAWGFLLAAVFADRGPPPVATGR